MNLPPDNSSPVVWAVWMGADTSRRLAAQQRISFYSAKNKLINAAKRGALVAVGKRKVGGIFTSVYEVASA